MNSQYAYQNSQNINQYQQQHQQSIEYPQSIKIKGNHYHNIESEYRPHLTLNTKAYQYQPYYSHISLLSNNNNNGRKQIMGINTITSIIIVYFDQNNLKSYKILNIKHELIPKQLITSFCLIKNTFLMYTGKSPVNNSFYPYPNAHPNVHPNAYASADIHNDINDILVLIGYRNGLIVLVDCINEIPLRLYNYDEKHKEIIKQRQIVYIQMLKSSSQPSFIVLFDDSTMLRYYITSESNNINGSVSGGFSYTNNSVGNNDNNIGYNTYSYHDIGSNNNINDAYYYYPNNNNIASNGNNNMNSNTKSIEFLERLKKIEPKINFLKIHSDLYNNMKIKNNTMYGYKIFEHAKEFNYFHAVNFGSNPESYVKFNIKTISAMQIVESKSFFSNILKSKSPSFNTHIVEPTILTMVNYEGYLIMYEFHEMEPLLSLKSKFAGYNSFTFSSNFNQIALAAQDDCIYVLDLNTLGMLKVEGHKSFISRIIFHHIDEKSLVGNRPASSSSSPSRNAAKNTQDYNLDKSQHINPDNFDIRLNPTKNKANWIRIIAGSLDSYLSICEFNDTIFTQYPSSLRKTTAQPLSTTTTNIIKLRLYVDIFPIMIKPLILHKVTDAIGWLDINQNLMAVSTMDGLIYTMLINDWKDNDSIDDDNCDNDNGRYKRNNEERLLRNNGFDIQDNNGLFSDMRLNGL